MLFSLLCLYTFLILFDQCGFCNGFACHTKPNMNRQFDVLVFAQQWPITYCINYMNKREGKECKFPSQNEMWTIHGTWPTRFDANINQQPACCNVSYFDLFALQAIKEQLENHWPSIEKEKPDTEFWEYEWIKHGTCSIVMDELSTVNKYFVKALDWLKQYNMTSILAKSNIIPGKGKQYTVLDVQKAVKSVLNKNPSINCYQDKERSEEYFSEIRLCFNKQLELVDCNGLRAPSKQISYTGGIITDCSNELINYPDAVPEYVLKHEHTIGWFAYFVCFVVIMLVLVFVWIRRRRIRENNEFLHLINN